MQVESVAVSPEDTAKVTAERPQWRSAARQLVASIHLVSAWQWSWQMDANGYNIQGKCRETSSSSLLSIIQVIWKPSWGSQCNPMMFNQSDALTVRTLAWWILSLGCLAASSHGKWPACVCARLAERGNKGKGTIRFQNPAWSCILRSINPVRNRHEKPRCRQFMASSSNRYDKFKVSRESQTAASISLHSSRCIATGNDKVSLAFGTCWNKAPMSLRDWNQWLWKHLGLKFTKKCLAHLGPWVLEKGDNACGCRSGFDSWVFRST